MPNWSYNKIAIKGKKEDVLKLLNIGLRNSALEEESDLASAFKQLTENGSHLESEYVFDSFKKCKIKHEKGVTLRTFLPMPKTFLEFDTANHSDRFKEESEMQKNEYGVVGWYDYNLKTLGTKWDSDLNNMEIEEVGDDAVFKFECDTAWSFPTEWVINVDKLLDNKLNFAFKSIEEGGFYALVGYFNKGDFVESDYLPRLNGLYEECLDENGEFDSEMYYNKKAEIESEMEYMMQQYIVNRTQMSDKKEMED